MIREGVQSNQFIGLILEQLNQGGLETALAFIRAKLFVAENESR
jgi:hypothetical protein